MKWLTRDGVMWHAYERDGESFETALCGRVRFDVNHSPELPNGGAGERLCSVCEAKVINRERT